MNYLFGHTQASVSLSESELRKIIQTARSQSSRLSSVPIEAIVKTLDQVGSLWSKEGAYFQTALRELQEELSFSKEMISRTLEIIPQLCSEKNLLQKLRVELGNEKILDSFYRHGSGQAQLKAVPYGVLLHVSAGNVFLGCIDSLLNGFLTKNISILKLSSQNQSFPHLFARSILEADSKGVLKDKFAMLQWKGGDESIESVLKKEVDAIIVWGGGEMIRTYRKGLAPGIPFIEHGPKISFQVLLKKPFEYPKASDALYRSAAHKIAKEISTWDQAACASPQNLFFEKGIDVDRLMNEIGLALDHSVLPRGTLDENEEVEVLKESYRAQYSAFLGQGQMLQGKDWLLHFDSEPNLRPSPLFRTLILKEFKNLPDLQKQLLPYQPHLQSCSYLATGLDTTSLLNALASTGVQRFAPLGDIMNALIGAPHDGRFALTELVRLVGNESKPDLIAFVNEAIRTVPFYHKLYQGREIHTLSQLKPISGKDLALEFVKSDGPVSSSLMKKGVHEGYYFSSGGTTGSPKYAFFTHQEFDTVGKMLARAYQSHGLKRGALCANLFVAGNLWSSFLAVEKALIHSGVAQLPIGGNADPDLILQYLESFKPAAVFGLPSMLTNLAYLSEKQEMDLKIPTIYYAGEHLTPQAKMVFKKIWKTESFFSAGYASVDAGPLGYQCPHTQGGEHHLFADQVHLEVVDSEAVITSLVREVMPIIHFKTGDQIEWKKSDTPCPCGSKDPKFTLLGRVDGQINLWSCRIQLSEIEKGLLAAGLNSPTYQVRISDETLDILMESDSHEVDESWVTQEIYRQSGDLQMTHSLAFLAHKIKVNLLPSGQIPRLARTGKIQKVVDLRISP